MGPSSCMQVIRPSPGVKILRLLQCHVCHVPMPRDHGKVYHRTDTTPTTPKTATAFGSVRLSVPSVRLCCSRLSALLAARAPCFWQDIFGVVIFILALDPFLPPSLRDLVTRSSCAHRAEFCCSGQRLDVTVPSRADSCLDSVTCVWPHLGLCVAGLLVVVRFRSVTVDGDHRIADEGGTRDMKTLKERQ